MQKEAKARESTPKGLNKRDFLIQSAWFGAGVVASIVGSLLPPVGSVRAEKPHQGTIPPVPEPTEDKSFLVPTERDGLLVYGLETPITLAQFPQLIEHFNLAFEAGKVEVNPGTIYSTETVSPALLEAVKQATNSDIEYDNFLRINYKHINAMLQEAELPYTLELRRVIIVDNSVTSPSGMDKEWMLYGPKDSHGGGSHSILRNYVSWKPFWGPSREQAWLALHELLHTLLALPDGYWHNYPGTDLPALAGIPQHWKEYTPSIRHKGGRSGIMNSSLPRLDTEAQYVVARRLFNGTAELPLTPGYYLDISGFPNRFATENVMKITSSKAPQLIGSKVQVFRKNPDLTKRSPASQPVTTSVFGRKPDYPGTTTAVGLEQLPLGEITINPQGEFVLQNVFKDIAFGENGEKPHIRTQQDTLLLKFVNEKGELNAFMWIDSVDFSMATGVEPHYPNKIELTINPVLATEMESTRPDTYDWTIEHRPLDTDFKEGTYSDPVLRALVKRYSTTQVLPPNQTPTPTPTATYPPTAVPTQITPVDTPTPIPTSTRVSTPAPTDTPTPAVSVEYTFHLPTIRK